MERFGLNSSILPFTEKTKISPREPGYTLLIGPAAQANRQRLIPQGLKHSSFGGTLRHD
jgi:hypothetical protein